MICKFFSTKKGGGNSSIDYLLNERVEAGTAKVLKGNEKLTRKIISQIKNKHKTTVGVLSFEESFVSERVKKELMESLENTLFQGMKSDDYNILWVEHTDKGRLELNFVIPKIHLSTGKQLQPYYHKQHFPLLEKWQKMINLKYGFSNPQDPKKQRSHRANIKDIKLVESYKQLDQVVTDAVTNLNFGSRAELITTLEKSGYEITRQNDKGFSIKLPNQKRAKKFKGGIYEQWNSTRELEKKFIETERRIEEFNQRDTTGELGQIEREYREYLSKNGRKNQERYKSRDKKYKQRVERADRRDRNTKDTARDKADLFGLATSGDIADRSPEDQQQDSQLLEQSYHDSTPGAIPGTRGEEVHSSGVERSGESNSRERHHLWSDRDQGGIDDTIRATITRSITDSRKKEQQTVEQYKQTRERIQEQYIQRSGELRENFKRSEGAYRETDTEVSTAERNTSERIEAYLGYVKQAFTDTTRAIRDFTDKLIAKVEKRVSRPSRSFPVR
jgi:hypothetical protein